MATANTADQNKVTINDNVLRTIDDGVVAFWRDDFPVTFESRKVPVIFVSQERWSLYSKQKGFRDESGVLILPIISVRRLDASELYERYVPKDDETKVIIARRPATKANDSDELLPFFPFRSKDTIFSQKLMDTPIQEIVMTQFPTFIKLRYVIILHTSYLSHANILQENLWKKFDAGRGYFKYKGYWIFGEITSSNDESNVDDFTDVQRIIRYSYNFEINAPLIDSKDTKIIRTFMKPSISFTEL